MPEKIYLEKSCNSNGSCYGIGDTIEWYEPYARPVAATAAGAAIVATGFGPVVAAGSAGVAVTTSQAVGAFSASAVGFTTGVVGVGDIINIANGGNGLGIGHVSPTGAVLQEMFGGKGGAVGDLLWPSNPSGSLEAVLDIVSTIGNIVEISEPENSEEVKKGS